MPTSNNAPPPRSSNRWSFGRPSGKVNAPREKRSSPSSVRAASSSAWLRGWCGHMYASTSTRPAASAAAYTSSVSATVIVSGFSHSTCLPASSAARIHGLWPWLGSGMYTASTS